MKLDKSFIRVFFILFTFSLLCSNGVVYAESTNAQEGEPNTVPIFQFIEPQQNLTIQQGEVLSVSWQDDDPDDDALVSLAYDTDADPTNDENFSWIVQNLSEDLDEEGDTFAWDTSEVPAGTYFVWAVINDSVNNPVYTVAAITITVETIEALPEEPVPEPIGIQEEPTPTPETAYSITEQVTMADGTVLEKTIINGPPEAPAGYERPVVSLPSMEDDTLQAATQMTAMVVPAFSWSFGCSATSAAMIAGYYDRNGYSNMYTGPTNGGMMPLDNKSWPTWVDSHGDTRNQCPLSATHMGLDGRTTRGHVDDYWVYVNQPGPDPWVAYGTEHTYSSCTGDYMHTNQWEHNYENIDGATTFWSYNSNSQLSCSAMEGYSITDDGTLGLRDFYYSRGYSVTDCYNQRTDNMYTGAFSFDDYKAEIDAGYPVMIHVEGHTMVGVGYYITDNTVILHDTWDYTNHTMTWGGSYVGRPMRSVSIVHPTKPSTSMTRFDFDGDGDADVGIFRPSNNLFTVKDQFYQKYGTAGDIAVPADYDGDGDTDIAIFRPSSGLWAVKDQFYAYYGKSGDIPVPADYDGDGKADLAIFRPSNRLWAVKNIYYVNYGTAGDIPVPADYDGDGDADIAVFRPSTGLWAVKDQFYQGFGKNGDIPIPADYDGDGDDDLAIFRPSTRLFAVRNQFYQGYGIAGDIPVPADYDGDGDADVAIFRPSKGLWAVKDQFYVGYGKNGDIPMPKTALYYYSMH